MASHCLAYLFELGKPFQYNLIVLIEVIVSHLVFRICKWESLILSFNYRIHNMLAFTDIILEK